MPGLAVLFWLGEESLSICPVATPEPTPHSKPAGSSILPPDFARSLKL